MLLPRPVTTPTSCATAKAPSAPPPPPHPESALAATQSSSAPFSIFLTLISPHEWKVGQKKSVAPSQWRNELDEKMEAVELELAGASAVKAS
jgi:hypothetical protein